MILRTDYHMHTPLCKHAEGPTNAYVEEAIAKGFSAMGFSEHCPLPDGRSAHVRMDEDQLDLYVNEVLRLRDDYFGKMDVRLGIEIDFLEGLESYIEKILAKYPWDYVIGSVHYLDNACTRGSWDKNAKDIRALYSEYFLLLQKLVCSGLCDIIAHFDLPKRTGFPPTDAERDAISETLREIRSQNLVVEINTSGYRHVELRKPEPYPNFDVISEAISLGIPLCVNSDAHKPGDVGANFGEIERFLRTKTGVKLAEFEQRTAILRDFTA
jgi:histidinol-phosphatase (PHP family)